MLKTTDKPEETEVTKASEYSTRDAVRVISEKILFFLRKNAAKISPAIVTDAVMSDHADVTGADADFALVMARSSIRREVTRQLNMSGNVVQAQQLSLNGFRGLQQYYVIEKENELAHIRLADCKKDELLEKARQYELLGKANIRHARLIRKYVKSFFPA